jgi:hypothetical protein
MVSSIFRVDPQTDLEKKYRAADEPNGVPPGLLGYPFGQCRKMFPMTNPSNLNEIVTPRKFSIYSVILSEYAPSIVSSNRRE